ncbi:MAG: Caulobacter phage Cr30 [Bacteroidota bacterium]|jgi:hypothetical protein
MAKYFRYFNKINYSVNDSYYDTVTNIMNRFTLEEQFKDNVVVYYKYSIKDGETPEQLAKRFYGESERHWIILIMNNVVDPLYDWPLSHRSFLKYVEKKYSTSEYANTANTNISGTVWARSNIHSYYKTIETTFNNYGSSKTLVIDSNTYDDLITGETQVDPELSDGNTIVKNTSKFSKTYYDYEYEVNENKRSIKILKKEFVRPLMEEFMVLTNNKIL